MKRAVGRSRRVRVLRPGDAKKSSERPKYFGAACVFCNISETCRDPERDAGRAEKQGICGTVVPVKSVHLRLNRGGRGQNGEEEASVRAGRRRETPGPATCGTGRGMRKSRM